MKVVFHRRSSSTESCLPLKVVFLRRLSSTEGCLPSKVVFHRRSSDMTLQLIGFFIDGRCWAMHVRVATCLCCNLYMLQISSVVNWLCCKLHMLQIACVANCTCCKLHVLPIDYTNYWCSPITHDMISMNLFFKNIFIPFMTLRSLQLIQVPTFLVQRLTEHFLWNSQVRKTNV